MTSKASVRALSRILILAAVGMGLAVTVSLASLPGHRLPAPRAIAPVAGARVEEGALQFAWKAPSGATRHYLVLARQAFETSGWTQLPEDPAFEVHAVSRPIVSLADLGIALDANLDLFWAAASGFGDGGILSFSEALPTHVLRKFSNRVEPSPHLEERGITRIEMPKTAGRRSYLIQLEAGYTIDPAMGEPAIPLALRESESKGKASRTLLVSYGDADPQQVRHQILEAGGLIFSYVPDRAFLVRLPESPIEALQSKIEVLQSHMDWVGTFHPAYKLSSRLDQNSTAPGLANVLVFPGGALQEVVQGVAGLGGSVVAVSDNGINKIVRVSASGPGLQGLAQHPDVAWIEPYVRPELLNNNAQFVVQTNISGSRRIWDMGILGQGQVVMTSDTGVNMGHQQFVDVLLGVSGFGEYPTHRKVIAYQKGSDSPDVTFGDYGSYHGSHTACSAVGSDDGIGVSTRDGMAKEAKLWHMDIGGDALGNSVDPFVDLNDLFQPSYVGNAGGAARISSNSWGAAVSGAYNLDSFTTDQFMWNQKDYLLVFANGNAASVGSVVAPATAKNCIGAGGTGNGTSANQIYPFTSKGPTADGRQKPTICSPGQSVISANAGGSAYVSLSGTSMATPVMSGAIALIRQYLTDGWYPTGTKVPANGFSPSAALLKAMAINSAANDVLSNQAPNNNIGYGRILVDNVCYFAGDSRRLLVVDNTEGLGHMEAIEFQVNVTNATIPLEVSLCWTDFPGNPLNAIQLVNDLNLIVTNGVTTYLGNVYSGGFSVTGGTADDRDVEEAVLIQTPTTGLWTVRIEAVNVPAGPQPFGLCITGGVGTNAGSIALDRASYGSTSTVEVQVTDVNAGSMVDVTFSSDTEPGGEMVTLAQSGVGIYKGSIPLSPFDGSLGDGTLQVSHGDVITATYVDASPTVLSQSLSATAKVSIATPVISNVSVVSQGAGAVRVTWNTDLNASSQVHYGPTPTLGTSTPVDPLAALTHSVLIDGLQVGQTYHFDVESQALNGNLTRDDNGGNHYQFTVAGGGGILLVLGGDLTATRAKRYFDALATYGWTYDLWSAGQHQDPPLGDLSSGLRSYKAVWWQVGLEEYPPFSDAARESLTQYLDGGGRLAVVGHDVVWSFGDVASSFYTLERRNWLQNTLHTLYNADPAGWSNVGGIASDPISGAYTGTLGYAEHRVGASGDEIDVFNGSGTATASWRSGDGSPDDAGLRWESGGPAGSAGTAFWGGQVSRHANMYFEWSGIQPNTDPSAAREDILDKTLIWLLGRDKPDITVTTPNGGETLTSNTANVEWTETTFGASPATRKIEFSPDGGLSWVLVTTDAGASPYAWDLTAVSNTPVGLIRITLSDNGSPAFSSTDRSNATFAIQRPGGDGVGPVVVAGSIASTPNPIDNEQPATLSATISDLTSGGSNVQAAEWSFGETPAAAGSGTAMTGAFGSPSVSVSANLTTSSFPVGTRKLWVRGQDEAGNWGNARSLTVVVNGNPLVAVGDAPRTFALWQNVPNPVVRQTMISYAVPAASPVDLAIFDIQGRVLRRLVRGNVGPGIHHVTWDGTDENGRRVDPGIYYYRFTAGDRAFERRMVTLR